MTWQEITREQFEAYERVRASGTTNMFAVDYVSALSGLDREEIGAIQRGYKGLMEKFPGVRGMFSKEAPQ
jgi:hypothetical protein